MRLLHQKNWFTSVRTVHSGRLAADTYTMGTVVEARGRLLVEQKTFNIVEAFWDVYRSPRDEQNGSRKVEGLTGLEAYFAIGSELKKVVGDQAGGLARQLFADCIRGIIQAETFLFAERGYPTLKAYGEYWERNYQGLCRYYSNLGRITRRWSDYVDSSRSGDTLFARTRNCALYETAGGFMALGILSDTFHEMAVETRLDQEGRVSACTARLLRVPDPVCLECAGLPAGLCGYNFPGLNKKQIAQIVGGPQGCEHLVDLISDMGGVAALALESV